MSILKFTPTKVYFSDYIIHFLAPLMKYQNKEKIKKLFLTELSKDAVLQHLHPLLGCCTSVPALTLCCNQHPFLLSIVIVLGPAVINFFEKAAAFVTQLSIKEKGRFVSPRYF